MLDFERQKWNTLQAEVLYCRTLNLQLFQMLDRSKDEVAQLQARCEFWRYLEPTQYARDEVNHSPELEWMQMEENQPESAATGSGGKVLMLPPQLEGWSRVGLRQRVTACLSI